MGGSFKEVEFVLSELCRNISLRCVGTAIEVNMVVHFDLYKGYTEVCRVGSLSLVACHHLAVLCEYYEACRIVS